MKEIACVLAMIFALALLGVVVESAAANFTPYPAPKVTAVSPAQNGVYNLPSIPFKVNVTMFRFDPTPAYEKIAWLNYSLDGQPEVAANITSSGPASSPDYGNTEIANGILSGMSDGPHTVYVRGNTTFSKYPAIPETSFSLTIYFRVDTVHPTLKVLFPQPGATYASPNVTLDFAVNEQINWAGYSIDGKPVVTSRINTTLTGLSYRTHVIRVYANDSAGNECFSPTIAFTVKDIEPPVISVLSERGSYKVSDVPLEFVVDKNVSWLGYSPDGRDNVTLAENTTLTGLSPGAHNLTVYATDMAGNVGSKTLLFVVSKPERFTTSPVVGVLFGSAVVAATGLLVYFKKRKIKARSLHED